MNLYRAPYGEYNNTVIKAANDMNYYTIQWNLDTLDYSGLTGEQMWNRIKDKLNNGDIILSHMRNQAMLAMDMAHIILFVVDGKSGLTAADREVAQILRKTKKPVILVVNKIDSQSQFDNVYDFYELGLGVPFAISSANSMGLGDLLDEVVQNFPEGLNTEYDEDIIRVAITGKPNAGKSSILNNILGESGPANKVLKSTVDPPI